MDPLEEMLKDLKEELEGRQEKRKKERHEKEVVSQVDNDIIKQFRRFQIEKESLHEAIESKAEEILTQAKNQLNKEIATMTLDLELAHEDVWDKIHNRYGLDPEKEYVLNVKKKKISEITS